MTETQITALGGEADLETVRWTGPAGEDQAPLRHVFLFASADPASDRLSDCGVALDRRGFVLTGQDGALVVISAHQQTEARGVYTEIDGDGATMRS